VATHKDLIRNPFADQYSALSLSQINDTLYLGERIIENLDDLALQELCGGYEADIDNLVQVILEEALQTVHSQHSLIRTPNSQFGYLDRLSASVDETLAISSFAYFICTRMPGFELSWHNIEWCSLTQGYRFLNITAARDHSKSYHFSNAYPVWKMYRYQKADMVTGKYNRELALSEKGMLITNEHSLAKELLSILKDTIDNNDLIRERLMPTGREGWGKEEITCANGANLKVKSYGSKIRGHHPHYIICDDYLNDSVLYSKDQREKYITIFKGVIENMIVPNGQIVVVGTPYHEQDLYGYLKSATKKWKCFEYPAIFPDGSILWESRYKLQDLLDKRESQGSIIFSREILVKPVTSDSTIFPYEMVSKCFTSQYALVNNYYSLPTTFKRIVVGCDFAISANVGADYSVFTVLGVDERDDLWLLHIWREKGKSFQEQIAVIQALYRDFRFDVAVMESNQMQQIFVQTAASLGLPVEGHNTTAKSKYDKSEGLPSLAVLFEQGKIKMPIGNEKSKEMMERLALELASMAYTDRGLQGVGDHDDMTMSLLMAVRAARKHTGFDMIML
jgi:hypothetical protein